MYVWHEYFHHKYDCQKHNNSIPTAFPSNFTSISSLSKVSVSVQEELLLLLLLEQEFHGPPRFYDPLGFCWLCAVPRPSQCIVPPNY